jgi:hypothetical protein
MGCPLGSFRVDYLLAFFGVKPRKKQSIIPSKAGVQLHCGCLTSIPFKAQRVGCICPAWKPPFIRYLQAIIDQKARRTGVAIRMVVQWYDQ